MSCHVMSCMMYVCCDVVSCHVQTSCHYPTGRPSTHEARHSEMYNPTLLDAESLSSCWVVRFRMLCLHTYTDMATLTTYHFRTDVKSQKVLSKHNRLHAVLNLREHHFFSESFTVDGACHTSSRSPHVTCCHLLYAAQHPRLSQGLVLTQSSLGRACQAPEKEKDPR